MIKRYEWALWDVHTMTEASEAGWDFVSGPFRDNSCPYLLACLMRREVVPGRVASPKEVAP